MSPHAIVVVLGDLGRSPRMANHARALLARGWRVTLAGYAENALPRDLAENPSLQVCDLAEGGAGRARAWLRLARLLRAKSWRLAVVQNPPGFPALWALPMRLRGRRVAIDWHNTGESLYALSRPRSRVRRAIYAWCERVAARRATTAWAVSEALASAVSPGATVVRDAPSAEFCRSARRPEDRLAWWRQALPDEPPPSPEAAWVVAPSSWGADEDHGAILRVARFWAARAGEWGAARPVVILASGRGGGRAAFEREAASLPPGPVSVRTVWLPPDAYPVFLAAADAGLCLHRSSSGLDLPMKLADMRGAGLPVLAHDYGDVLREAGDSARDAAFFKDDAGLARCIHDLATNDGGDVRRGAAPATWEENWDRALGAWCAGIEGGTRREAAILKPWLGLGGADRWSVDAALALGAAGWNATIWTNHHAREAAFAETLDGRVRVESRASGAGGGGDRFRAARVILRQRALLRRMKREGAKPTLVICDVLPHVARLARRLWPEAAVLVYCHYPDRLMAPKSSGWLHRVYRFPIDRMEERGLAAAHLVATNSRFTAEVMGRVFGGTSAARPEVIYPGVDLPSRAEPPGDAGAGRTFLTVSRIDPRKGLPLAVAAMSALRARAGDALFARCRLVIAGGYDGNFSEVRALLDALRAQVRDGGLGGRVEFRLNLSDAELEAEWRGAFALVHPMSGEHFGIVPVEAMARGLPVLAVNEGGPLETVVDGVTGALRAADADAFAEVMAGWLRAPEVAREFGRAGRERAEALFGRERFAREFVAAAETAVLRRARG